MKSADLATVLAALLVAACGGGGGSGNTQIPPPTGDNVVPVSVDGTNCNRSRSASYPNKPCVTVTVCTPGTNDCQVIDDVLLDTGSYGLRLFKTVLGNAKPQQVAVGGEDLATCVNFVDGSSEWGPVQVADVVLGGEPPAQVPIHVIDSGYANAPGSCSTPDSGPDAAGFNGILGVGYFTQDCGDGCATTSPPLGRYFTCSGTSCTDVATTHTAVPLASQVQNPVAGLSQDNNGMIIVLPPLPAGGKESLEGWLLLGIGTRTNNHLAGAVALPVNGLGEFETDVGGAAFTQSFIDTGSNGLFFDASQTSTSLPACPGPNSSWYCPALSVPFVATNRYLFGVTSQATFSIGNFNASGNNLVLPQAGGTSFSGDPSFDWGLPFYLGRRVAIGFDRQVSTLGTGPFLAFVPY
ncbi:MAG TPA: DUF3443 family protein [Anaeromyxobacter sp.]|nr:DUF3443 family protein [Anaeromyxobacter sp.]